MVIDSMKIYH